MISKKLKQFITIITLVSFLFIQGGTTWAFEIPSAPTVPTAPTAPQSPSQPVAPEAPSAPDPFSTPSPTESPRQTPTNNSIPENTDNNTSITSNNNQESPDLSTIENQGTVGQTANGQIGNTSIDTGDATNTGIVISLGNNNLSNPTAGNISGGASIINSGNGNGSTNNGSASIVNDKTTIQNNNSDVNNGLNQESVTGQNSASRNVGDSSIVTGDANTTGTIITGVNNNVTGAVVSEFNIVDDHVGDIVLDFNNPNNCVIGCDGGSVSAINSGNGNSSQNTANVSQTANNSTFQNNDSTVGNSMTLLSDSGNNTVSRNTGGDSSITTGDTNVVANALTFVNNNIAGNVVFGVVNIFGTLIGDIILPDSQVANCTNCGTNSTVANTNNGAGSTNTGSLSLTNNDNTFQTNDATIENNLTLAATTGDNSTSRNTGGDSSITTGDSTVDVKTLNIANSNLDGGNMWLVIVNKAGEWVGQLLGAPVGSLMAGSTGTEFKVASDGTITATNSGNDGGSTNNANISQTSNNTTVQSNTASIVNSLNLTANTGGNSANSNTGGNSTIKTGDAKIIANLVNFVNNNIKGNGRLIVTFVNIFGKWTGDFITPGSKKENKENVARENLAIGGMKPQENNQNDQNKNNNSQNQNQNNNNGNSTAGRGGVSASVNNQSNTNSTSSGSSNNGSSSQAHQGNTLIAGISTSLADAAISLSSKSEKPGVKVKATSINLAWLILILPLVAVIFLTNRKFRIIKRIKGGENNV